MKNKHYDLCNLKLSCEADRYVFLFTDCDLQRILSV